MSNRRLPAGLIVCALIALTSWSMSGARAQGQTTVPLPNKPDTLHFAVIGDNGTGERPQYELAQQLTNAYARFQFPLVVMMGDNLYGSERPQDFAT
jgi:hypothetical protein